MARVLVVDDESEVCSLLKEYLGSLGYDVATACDGEEALEKTRNFHPDCVLLDLRMPIMGGEGALQRIKSLSPETEIIIVTAINKVDIAEKCLLHGAFAYVAKPIDLDYLESLIQCSLEHRKAVKGQNIRPV
ncbi:MAG: response regulator [Nitrospinae bacterium]|nr:response regulator [Nitrospinota bacterium]